MPPASGVPSTSLDSPEKFDTPASEESKSTSTDNMSIVSLVSYWILQIRLAEAASKHSVSLGFFKIALETECEPLDELTEELKDYIARHGLATELEDQVEEIYDVYYEAEDRKKLKISVESSQERKGFAGQGKEEPSRAKPSSDVTRSMSSLGLLSVKDKSPEPPESHSVPTKPSSSPGPTPSGTISPASGVPSMGSDSLEKSDTPASEESNPTDCYSCILSSPSYWITQIRLAEAASKHFVSLSFFQLAFKSDFCTVVMDSDCEPQNEILEELKDYVARHCLPRELEIEFKYYLWVYDILKMNKKLEARKVTAMGKLSTCVVDSPTGTIAPASGVPSTSSDSLGKSDTPASEASDPIDWYSCILNSPSHWITQIRLAESFGRHHISLSLFKVAMGELCKYEMLVELKNYVARNCLQRAWTSELTELLRPFNLDHEFMMLQRPPMTTEEEIYDDSDKYSYAF